MRKLRGNECIKNSHLFVIIAFCVRAFSIFLGYFFMVLVERFEWGSEIIRLILIIGMRLGQLGRDCG